MPVAPEKKLHLPAIQVAPISISLVLLAGVCWTWAIWLLLKGDLRSYQAFFASPRLLFYMSLCLASALTFIPIEQRYELPGLAFQGMAGSILLCYTIAFVPAPTAWLLSLPDTPVYLLLIMALFWLVSAIVMPFVYVIGLSIWKNRAHQFDLRRVRRQSHECGLLVAMIAALASLRVLTWVSLLLLVLILIIAELLFLSRIEPQY